MPERAFYDTVIFALALSCVTETLSAALLGAMVERADDGLVRAAMHGILEDEIRHSRLGWAHLAAESKRASPVFVRDYLPALLRGTVTEELFASWAEPPEQAALAGLGALDRADRRRTFEDTMRLVVFPGLQRFGIDVSLGEGWIAGRAPAGTSGGSP